MQLRGEFVSRLDDLVPTEGPRCAGYKSKLRAFNLVKMAARVERAERCPEWLQTHSGRRISLVCHLRALLTSGYAPPPVERRSGWEGGDNQNGGLTSRRRHD